LRLPHHGYLEAIGRLGGYAKVYCMVPDQHIALAIVMAVALREVVQYPGNSKRNKWQ
jgi:hypothetical protein